MLVCLKTPVSYASAVADPQEIKAETEHLVKVANDRLIQSIERSERRVLEAEWNHTGLYRLLLECGHTMNVSPPQLRSWVLCLDCVRKKLL